MLRRSWFSARQVRSVESRSGSIGKICAAVYTEVVLVRACSSTGEPTATVTSTSAIATRMRTAPSASGCATDSWSRSRESSLSIEHHRSERRSRISGARSVAARVMPASCARDRRGEIRLESVIEHRLARDALQLSAVVVVTHGGMITANVHSRALAPRAQKAKGAGEKFPRRPSVEAGHPAPSDPSPGPTCSAASRCSR